MPAHSRREQGARAALGRDWRGRAAGRDGFGGPHRVAERVLLRRSGSRRRGPLGAGGAVDRARAGDVGAPLAQRRGALGRSRGERPSARGRAAPARALRRRVGRGLPRRRRGSRARRGRRARGVLGRRGAPPRDGGAGVTARRLRRRRGDGVRSPRAHRRRAGSLRVGGARLRLRGAGRPLCRALQGLPRGRGRGGGRRVVGAGVAELRGRRRALAAGERRAAAHRSYRLRVRGAGRAMRARAGGPTSRADLRRALRVGGARIRNGPLARKAGRSSRRALAAAERRTRLSRASLP